MNTLTDQQIDHLFTFVRSKYVRYIDMQYEVVDHLATAIEEEMNSNPSTNFETALDTVYDRFPITGFSHWVTVKEKQMMVYWRKRTWAYLKQHFTFPKIIGSMALMMIIFTSFQLIPYPLGIWLFILMLYSLYAALSFKKQLGFSREEIQKSLVVSTFYNMTGTVGMFLTIGIMPHLKYEANTSYSTTMAVVSSIIIGLVLIYDHANHTAFPGMIKSELKNKYHYLDISKRLVGLS